jgi:hypothetical protein
MARKRYPRTKSGDAQANESVSVLEWLEGPARGFLDDPNIVGVGLGKKHTSDGTADKAAIVFHVVRKLADTGDILAIGSSTLPRTIAIGDREFPTDVVADRRRPCDAIDDRLAARRRRQPAIAPGLSISNAGSLAYGTGGAIVRHRPTGQLALLSSYHVLSRFDGNKAVCQPGGGDNGDRDKDRFGNIITGFLDGDGDAAIASIERRSIEPRIFGLGVAAEAIATATQDMLLVKSGRSTGVTYGRVSSPAFVQSIDYPKLGTSATISGFEIEILSPPPAGENGSLALEGDSGSGWMLLGPDGKPTTTLIGLTTAVSADGRRAFACHASRIFKRLEIDPVRAADVPSTSSPALNVPTAEVPSLPISSLVATPLMAAAQRLFVTARKGLVLRAGPDTSFADLKTLPFNTGVFEIGREGNWIKVDLQGDGKADGYMFGGFLDPHPVVETASTPVLTTVDAVALMCPNSPRANIILYLPMILDGLRAHAIGDRDMFLVAIATIRAEVEAFRPMDEGISVFNTRVEAFDRYEPGSSIGAVLGNNQLGDGARFKGRGFVQLTGRENYRRIGGQLHLDLIGDPPLANQPDPAAFILAQFLKNNEARIRTSLSKGDLAEVRRAVNGGSHGFTRFKAAFDIGRGLGG